MSSIKMSLLYFTCLFMVFVAACSTNSVETTEVKHYPIDSLEGIITQSGIQMDKEITSDANGSLRIATSESTTVRLYETGENSHAAFHIFFMDADGVAAAGGSYQLVRCSIAGIILYDSVSVGDSAAEHPLKFLAGVRPMSSGRVEKYNLVVGKMPQLVENNRQDNMIWCRPCNVAKNNADSVG